jgi:polyphosphate glucokinase
MELVRLPNGRTHDDHAEEAPLRRFGNKQWRRHVADVVTRLTAALEADDGGGVKAKRLRTLPQAVRLGSNAHAFAGGYGFWKHHA